ncbi:MAG: hydrogenase expression/formation protein HypE [Candidatus Diapherotrites archaeon]|uniref:Hydrogenase expression/formation protein HypE n=1 Tax=Candidatus Iainarchaeum sp. TaxID=3101447 RepID=A0A8T4C5U8_9ARCH|nr:hydrogenase expression/formation protein HypE [Candidatus Diapherotrites archaeon]
MNQEDCFLDNCPPFEDRSVDRIKLSEGSGGQEMHRLIHWIQKMLPPSTNWNNTQDDAATIPFPSTHNESENNHLVFTTDSYVVTPLFFPGGNIGTLAFCGTINDLVVMGAEPLGISLGMILEEGLPRTHLESVIQTIGALSQKYHVPIVTGDTKVMERKSIDKMVLNTSGVGHAARVLNTPLRVGDDIIVSGSIGEHGAALLAKRFDIDSSLETDSQPLLDEMRAVRQNIKQARDITRGGLVGVLHELARKNNIGMQLSEEQIPIRREVQHLTELLGIDPLSLACEGRMVCACSPDNTPAVVSALKKFNDSANVIGRVTQKEGLFLQTSFGNKIIPEPSGVLTPRIC